MLRSSPLFKRLQSVGHLSGIASLMSWDQETFMPSGASPVRADQFEAITTVIHEAKTSPAFYAALSEFVDLKSGEISSELSDEERACVRDIYRDWKKAQALPTVFVGAFARAVSEATHVWQSARSKNDFSAFAPHLQTLIELSKKKAAYIDAEKRPYDVLLDEYEPDMTMSVLTPLFRSLRDELAVILSAVLKRQPQKNPLMNLCFDENKQWDFGIKILEEMGYDFTRGRQDRSTHPFTIHFHPDDVRITTRLKETSFSEGFSSSVHEGGHALYEQGVRKDWFGTPLGEACSLGIHESQSRLWENVVCNAKPFWDGHYHHLQQVFPESLKDMDQATFLQGLNFVSPGLIRVEADEVTYNYHVMIRYELEQALFEHGASVYDLPRLWAEKYTQYLGVSPTTDAEGVLQDIHWSGASFGYFPTYTLGNLFSVMIYNQAKQSIPDLETHIRHGNMTVLTRWLNAHIHHHGRRYSSRELIQLETGQTLSVDPFITYLKAKYLV